MSLFAIPQRVSWREGAAGAANSMRKSFRHPGSALHISPRPVTGTTHDGYGYRIVRVYLVYSGWCVYNIPLWRVGRAGTGVGLVCECVESAGCGTSEHLDLDTTLAEPFVVKLC